MSRKVKNIKILLNQICFQGKEFLILLLPKRVILYNSATDETLSDSTSNDTKLRTLTDFQPSPSSHAEDKCTHWRSERNSFEIEQSAAVNFRSFRQQQGQQLVASSLAKGACLKREMYGGKTNHFMFIQTVWDVSVGWGCFSSSRLMRSAAVSPPVLFLVT